MGEGESSASGGGVGIPHSSFIGVGMTRNDEKLDQPVGCATERAETGSGQG